MENSIISIRNLNKIYPSGLNALQDINLEIQRGEIFALLGPNGAGKTTLISIVCGIVNPGSGQVLVSGHDIVKDYREARKRIGLVPQELSVAMFETVWDTVTFSRGMFGTPMDKVYISVDRFGNMSSASVAVALDEGLESGWLTRGSLVLMVAFGAGFTWAANVIQV